MYIHFIRTFALSLLIKNVDMDWKRNMNEQEELQWAEEYDTRIVVFKCFKGTRSQFDQHLDKYFKGRNVKPYLVYTKQHEIDNVEHSGVDRNILNYKGNRENERIRAEKIYLKL